MSEAQKKRFAKSPVTEETKKKTSAALKGRKVSAETRAKLSEIQKARWERWRKEREKT
jgi:hypothetical protein